MLRAARRPRSCSSPPPSASRSTRRSGSAARSSESGLPFAGVVVNRVHHDLLGDRPSPTTSSAALRRPQLGPELAARRSPRTSTTTTCSRGATSATSRGSRAELGDSPLLLVPQLDDDVHDVDGLLADAPLPVRLRRRARAADRRGRGLVDLPIERSMRFYTSIRWVEPHQWQLTRVAARARRGVAQLPSPVNRSRSSPKSSHTARAASATRRLASTSPASSPASPSSS